MKASISRTKTGIVIRATGIITEEDKNKVIKSLLEFPIQDPSLELQDQLKNGVVAPCTNAEHDYDTIFIY